MKTPSIPTAVGDPNEALDVERPELGHGLAKARQAITCHARLAHAGGTPQIRIAGVVNETAGRPGAPLRFKQMLFYLKA